MDAKEHDSHNESMYAVLTSQHDQDIENAKAWWREHDDAAKAKVFAAISHEYTTPIAEVISRFAQIGFTEICLRCKADFDQRKEPHAP